MSAYEDRVEELAAKATEGFFKTLFEHVPAGTTGDFPPDATMAFEEAAKSAVRTILANVPTKTYYVLHRVEWQPSADGDDGPTDMDHHLAINDDRVVASGIQGIGDADSVLVDLRRSVREFVD